MVINNYARLIIQSSLREAYYNLIIYVIVLLYKLRYIADISHLTKNNKNVKLVDI